MTKFKWIEKEKAEPKLNQWYLCIIKNETTGDFFVPYVAKYIGKGLFRMGVDKKELYQIDSQKITHISEYDLPKQ